MAPESRERGRKLHARTAKMSSLRDDDQPRRSGGNLFLWTIAILLLIGFALACWIFSFYVFGHPENTFSYSILSKLKKLEPLKRFEVTAAPRGEFLTAAQLNDRYGKMTDRELSRASEALLRNYVRNYKLTQDLVPYVIGSFNILDSYELNDHTAFPSGVVALGQSTETPNVLLEHVFSADPRDVQTLQRMLLTGLDLRLDKSVDLSAIVSVKRLSDGRLQFTAVPLLYGSYASSTGPGIFSLEPPETLHLKDGLPILNENALNDAEQKYAAYRMRAGLDPSKSVADGTAPPKRPAPQLMRVARPTMANDKPVTPPPAAAVTPKGNIPVKPALPVAANAVAASDAPPSPAPSAPAAQPSPAATPAGVTTSAGTNWSTYAPGQMPHGRLVTIPDASDLATNGLSGERVYLQGNFVVSATGQNRAVLRSNTALTDTLGLGGRTSNIRVIVEFPAGSHPPAEGTTFARDSRRPFLITDVRKGADGVVNVYAREITAQ